MMLQEEDIQTLTGFGLTILQAKVYLTLTKIGNSTVRRIAEETSIARQEAQRVTHELLSIGLLEKLLVSPTEFRPLSIEEAVAFLKERRKRTSVELEKKANDLLKRFSLSSKEPRAVSEKSASFVVTNGKEAVIGKSRQISDRTTLSCDIVNGSSENFTFTSSLFKEQNIKALRRHVRIRIIAGQLKKEQSVQEIYRHAIDNPNFEIRTLPSRLPVIFGIYDAKEMLVLLSTDKRFGESPMLWTNNETLLLAAQSYFDQLWRKAKPIVSNGRKSNKNLRPEASRGRIRVRL